MSNPPVLRFLARISVFLGALVTFSFALVVTVNGLAAMIGGGRLNAFGRKVDRLASVEGPKLVLMGGSNLAYGVDSRLLEEELGMPVVNLGLQGSIPVDFQLKTVTPFLGPGDILVNAVEHGVYKRSMDGSATLLRLLVYYPSALTRVSLRHVPDFFANVYPAISDGLNQVVRGVGRRLRSTPGYDDLTNAFGDFEGHKGSARRFTLREEPYWAVGGLPINEGVLKTLREARAFCEENKIHFVTTFSPTPDTPAVRNAGVQLAEEISDLNVISDPISLVFPDTMFFDTINHLRYQFRGIRTHVLARDIKEHLASG